MERRGIPLAEVVADALAQSLKMGVYECGDRLAESVIAREMTVSQTTARDALAIIERQGWVIKLRHRGYVVRSFQSEDVRELYVLRATLECLALEWAMAVMKREDEMRLSGLISEARIQAGVSSWNGVHHVLFCFHEMIAMVANMPQTNQVLTVLHNQCWLVHNMRSRRAPSQVDDFAIILTNYGDLLTSIRYRQHKAAINTLHDIIMAEGRQLISIFDLLR